MCMCDFSCDVCRWDTRSSNTSKATHCVEAHTAEVNQRIPVVSLFMVVFANLAQYIAVVSYSSTVPDD